MRISDWSSDVCSSDLASTIWIGATSIWSASWPPAAPPSSGAGRRNRVGAGGMAENPESADKPLKLRAHDPADMDVVAALLQDALVPLGDMTYLAKETRFVMVANRFRWGSGETP